MKNVITISAKDYKPTPESDRNAKMVEEVRKFAQSLKALHKELTVWEKSTQSELPIG